MNDPMVSVYCMRQTVSEVVPTGVNSPHGGARRVLHESKTMKKCSHVDIRNVSWANVRMNKQCSWSEPTMFPVMMILRSSKVTIQAGDDGLAESTERYYKRMSGRWQRQTN